MNHGLNGEQPARLTWQAKLVLVLAVLMIVAGGIWHGVTLETYNRFWRDIFDRPGGPMSFRFFIQPALAFVTALLDGIKDARTGRSPYFWTVLSVRGERIARLNEGLVAMARTILLGIVMDVIYQLKVFGTFYPLEALLIALLLAFVPYLLLRGPVTRIARWWMTRS